ncbi:DUF4199 domain-containing protein [Kaistella sp.]|uniref:DUF4199 domain-containing protein n=1 Tax=Kaistella sp. TaxID=2782235 RepID=UPI003C56A2A4
MIKNVYTIGFMLFIATMVVFFGMYFFGMNTNYFDNTMLINSFLMPILYLAGSFASVYSLRKTGVKMGFRDVFGRAFKPMFVGGFLSVVTMYLFLNFVDPAAKDLLNFQYLERQKIEMDKEYNTAKPILKTDEQKAELEKEYEQNKLRISHEMIKDKDFFSFRQFSYYFAAILMFYVILSTFFASFFRSRSEL